jgi:hypothetical protein
MHVCDDESFAIASRIVETCQSNIMEESKEFIA